MSPPVKWTGEKEDKFAGLEKFVFTSRLGLAAYTEGQEQTYLTLGSLTHAGISLITIALLYWWSCSQVLKGLSAKSASWAQMDPFLMLITLTWSILVSVASIVVFWFIKA
jgi:hypothetical protein